VANVSELTRLVRGEVTSLARRVLAALVTIDVHSRDIVASLLSKGCSNTQAFEWQKQLRYYWEDEDLVVRQVWGPAA
jgi:dynein heavy chain